MRDPTLRKPCACGSGDASLACCEAPRRLDAAELRRLTDLLNAGRYLQVENITRHHLETHYAFGPLWKLLGAALVQQGKDAVLEFERASQLLPGDAEAHYCLAEALQDRENFLSALDSYRRTIELNPIWPEAHNNLGTALLAVGRPAEALERFDAAVSLRPEFAAAWGGRGDAMLRLDRLEDAVDSYQRMLLLEPNLPQTQIKLANALRGLGKLQQAFVVSLEALRMAPDLVEAHYGIGNVYFELGRLDQAAEAYKHSIALAPGYAEAHSALSMIYRQMGRPIESAVSCRQALALQPNAPDAIAMQGEIFASDGDFQAAEAEFRRALALNPELSEGWAGIARCRKMTAADDRWLEAVQDLAAKPLPVRQKALLNFALGKYFDDLNRYGSAFAHYRAANELTKRYGIRYDRAQMARVVERNIAVQDAAWLRSAHTGNSSSRPVFIVGMPRSGTSLAEQILASHPAIFGAGELPFWNAAAGRLFRPNGAAQKESSNLCTLAIHYLHEIQTRSPDAQRVIDKMPANLMNLGIIHAALPNARIIHLRRNPVDTCLSIYFQIFSNAHPYANDLDDLTHFYSQYVRMATHWQNVLPSEALLDVPYEALVDDPEKWTRSMLEFLDLPWDARCMDFHLTKRTVVTSSNWQVRQEINKSSVGRWHHYADFVKPLKDLLPSAFS